MKFTITCSFVLVFFLSLPFNVFSQKIPVNSSFEKADLALSTGDYAKAARLYQQSAAAAGSGNPNAALSLIMQAFALVLDKKADKAYRFIKEVEKDLEDKKYTLSSAAAIRLNLTIGAYHYAYREFDYALPALNKALASTKNTEVESCIRIELNSLMGNYYFDRNQFDKARTYFTEAEKETTNQNEAEINYDLLGKHLMFLGDIHYEKDESKEAIEKYERILEQKTKLLAKEPQREGELYYKIGKVYFKFKELETTQPFLEKALTFALSTTDKSDAEYMLSVVLVSVKNYESALSKASEAVADLVNGNVKEPQSNYTQLLNLGSIFKIAVNTVNSEDYYAKTIPDKEDWSIAEELKGYNLSEIIHLTNPPKSKDFNLSLLSYERADRVIPKFPKPEQLPAKIEVLMAKGALYFAAKNYKEAKTNYEEALELMSQIYDKKHPLVSEASRAMGEIYYEEKVFGEAMSFINDALSASMKEGASVNGDALPDTKQAAFPYELLYALGIKGSILRDVNGAKTTEKDLLKALEAFDAALELLNELRKTFRNEGAKYQLAQLNHKFSQQALICCEQLFLKTNKKEFLDKAFAYVESTRSSLLLQAIRDLKARKIASVPEALTKKENDLKVAISFFNSQIFYELRKGKAKDLQKINELNAALDSNKIAHEQLLVEIEKKYPKYFALKYKYQLPTIAKIQENLKNNELILEYAILDSSIYVFSLSNKELNYFKIEKLGAKFIHNTVNNLLSAVKNFKFKTFFEKSHLLYNTLFEARLKLPKNVKLIIVPEAELNYIPFEMLVTEPYDNAEESSSNYAALSYLLKDHSISYAYSAQLLIESRAATYHKKEKGFLGISPDYAMINEGNLDMKNAAYAELPYGIEEVSTIAKLLKGASFFKAEASETAFKAHAAEYSILHLASHGELDNSNPLFSKLVLYGDSENDGFLHTHELFSLELNAELVCLSACNTGVGEVQRGEGVMSLARGFAYAGTANMVMSLWPISDQSTNYIMVSFYENLRDGMPKDEAMQKAKLKYINEVEGKASSPLLWAGLIVSGNPDPVYTIKKDFVLHWYEILGIALVLVLLLAGVYFLIKKFAK